MQSFNSYNFMLLNLESRIREILEQEQPSINRPDVLKELLGLIDLTTLSGNDTTEK